MASSQPVTLMYQKTLVEIGAIQLDASIQETHSTRVATTDSPVEKGVDITDHLRKKPDRVRIEGIVTNHPFGGTPNTETVTTPDGSAFQFTSTSAWAPGRAETAYQQLRSLAGASALITIVTGLRTYSNMTMEELEVPRNAQIGEAVRFTATFKEIQIVQNETVRIARTQPNAIPKKNLNKVATPPVPKSIAAHGLDFANAKWGVNPTGLAH